MLQAIYDKFWQIFQLFSFFEKKLLKNGNMWQIILLQKYFLNKWRNFNKKIK
jgi:hypothetical protein